MIRRAFIRTMMDTGAFLSLPLLVTHQRILNIDVDNKILTYRGPALTFKAFYKMLIREFEKAELMGVDFPMVAETEQKFVVREGWTVEKGSFEFLDKATLTENGIDYTSDRYIPGVVEDE